MSKVLVLYYSSYGHIEAMANAVAEGAAGVAGTEVTIKRVPELVPDDVAQASGIKLDQAAPIATPDELANAIDLTRSWHAFATADLWIGAAIGVALIVGAIHLRRWRESE
mgnify:CR=1 FL=1